MLSEFFLGTGQMRFASMMSAPLENQISQWSTFSVGDFHVRISALQVKALGSLVQGLVCGLNSRELLANYDRSSLSWRTSQRSFFEGWTPYLGAWPRSAMMRGGIVFALDPSAPLIKEIGSSLWPTPVRMDGGFENISRPIYRSSKGRPEIRTRSGISGTPSLREWIKVWPGDGMPEDPPNPEWIEFLMGFPPGWTLCGPQNQDPANSRESHQEQLPGQRKDPHA